MGVDTTGYAIMCHFGCTEAHLPYGRLAVPLGKVRTTFRREIQHYDVVSVAVVRDVDRIGRRKSRFCFTAPGFSLARE
jgi:hypothetical protein